jgi:sugar O-acyltransferase (sialic acid O-acetyltransferase NeuD family)
MRRDIVIFGSGGYARGTAEAAEADAAWHVTAFAGQNAGNKVFGRPVLSEDEVLSGRYPLVGVVAIGDNWRRQQVIERIKAARPDFAFCRIVHPRAMISPSAQIGEGTVILAGSVVGADARLGAHVSIYTNAVVEHDSVLGDFSSLAPAAALGGTVRLGARSFVGLGARVIHGLSIGADVVIGAGATVLQEVPDRAVVAGTPARVVRTRKPAEPYL